VFLGLSYLGLTPFILPISPLLNLPSNLKNIFPI